jgi:pimeloyl-ACP methyl ester carboxylesterase
MTVASRHPEKVRGLVIAGSTREPTGVSRLAFEAYAAASGSPPNPSFGPSPSASSDAGTDASWAAAITAGGHFATAAPVPSGTSPARASASGSSPTAADPRHQRHARPRLPDRRRAVPRGRAGVTNGSSRARGHLSNVDQPEVFTRLIEEFVGTLPA